MTKRINGRFYDYWQRTFRAAGSTRTENKYIGPSGTGAALGACRAPDGKYQYTEQQIEGIKELGRLMDLPDDDREEDAEATATLANTNAFTPVTLPAAKRRDDERVRYGNLNARIREQEATVKRAKRKASGTGATNPFLGQSLKA